MPHVGSASPIEIIRRDIQDVDPFHSISEEQVLDTLRAAIATVGDVSEAEAFTWRLATGLDEQSRGGLGLTGYMQLEQVGSLLHNPQATRPQRWGALSLLGVLAMSFDPAIENGSRAVDPATHRAQLAGTAARRMLEQFVDATEGTHPHQQAAAVSFLGHTGTPTSLVADNILKLLEEPQPEATPAVADSPETTGEIPIIPGCTASDPTECTLVTISSHTQELLGRMDWLDVDFPRQGMQMRDILHDGTVVARVLDFTPGNETLRAIHDDLMQSPAGVRFWSQLATTITRHVALTRRCHRTICEGKVDTFYMSNKGADGHTPRAYYTFLGNARGEPPVIALLASMRFKKDQPTVLKLLGVAD